MSPVFYEDSLGAKLAERAAAAMDAAHEAEDDCVEDPNALARAESEARRVDPETAYEQLTSDWVSLLGRSKLSGLMDEAGMTSHVVTAPLEAAGVPFVWDPYPPEEMPSYRPGYGAVDRPFELLVPADRREEALALLDTGAGSASVIGLPVAIPRSEESQKNRRRWIWMMLIFFGINVVIAALLPILNWLGLL